MKNTLVFMLAALVSGCATYDEAVENNDPTNEYYSEKNPKEVLSCIKQKWAFHPPITDVEIDGGYKVYTGVGAGAGVTILESGGGTHVTSYIPSASWARSPMKLSKGVEDCK